VALFRRRAEEPGVAAPADPVDNDREAGPAAPESGADGPADRLTGPRDRSEVVDTAGLLDFGALLLAPRDGMQLHLETDEAGQGVLAVTVLVAGSAVQLQAFAAPKTMGIWAEIRGEIAQSIVAQGGTADIVDGPFGRELLTRMPQRGTDGRTQFQPARFIGIDGPRWFLRAVVSGAGAADPTQVAPALAVVRDVVVSRGDAPMAPRDLLPLTLPVELSAAPEPPQEYVGKRRREDDLRPFDRGPEITEIH
jgi:hypothetical protein